MSDHSSSSPASLIPHQSMPEGSQDFSKRVRGQLDGQEKGGATVAQALEGWEAMLDAIAALALLLSMVGIFALVASLVAQRTREIGIRIASGSSIRHAMFHVAEIGVRASLAGLVLGLILCAGALRAMRSVLYGVQVYDAATIVGVVVTLGLVTLLAASIPVLRIARIDPATTLRDE